MWIKVICFHLILLKRVNSKKLIVDQSERNKNSRFLSCKNIFDVKYTFLLFISVFSPRSLPKILPLVGWGGISPRSLSKFTPRFLPKNPPPWAGNWMLTYSKHLSKFFPPAAGWKHNTILEMYINWNGLPRPLLGPQNFFRRRRAKSITRFHEMYVNWNDLLRPLLEPQIFFACGELKTYHAFKKCMLTGMATAASSKNIFHKKNFCTQNFSKTFNKNSPPPPIYFEKKTLLFILFRWEWS